MKRMTLSTDSVNRYGYRVLTAGIKLDNFLKNPVMFWGHSTWNMPIGTWEDVKVEGSALTGIPVFDEVTEMSKTAKQLYEKGTIRTSSIGFNEISTSSDPQLALPGQRYETVTSCELLEVSLVSIPANPEATVELDFNFDKNVNLLSLNKPINMDLKKIALRLGLDESATEEQILGAIENIKGSEAQVILQLGIDKGVVTDANKKVFEAAIDKDPTGTKQYFLDYVTEGKETSAAQKGEASKTETKTLAQTVATARTAGQKTEKTEPVNDRSNWTYLDWAEKDPKGFRKLATDDTAKYDAIVNAYLDV